MLDLSLIGELLISLSVLVALYWINSLLQGAPKTKPKWKPEFDFPAKASHLMPWKGKEAKNA